jgi:hypothetical protein
MTIKVDNHDMSFTVEAQTTPFNTVRVRVSDIPDKELGALVSMLDAELKDRDYAEYDENEVRGLPRLRRLDMNLAPAPKGTP